MSRGRKKVKGWVALGSMFMLGVIFGIGPVLEKVLPGAAAREAQMNATFPQFNASNKGGWGSIGDEFKWMSGHIPPANYLIFAVVVAAVYGFAYWIMSALTRKGLMG